MSDKSFLSTYYLSKYSKKKSKVVLSGDGADCYLEVMIHI